MRKALYILADLRDEDIRWFANNGAQRALDPGTRLIKAGESVKELYFVTSGSLQITDDQQNTIAELGLGDIIGEMSFVEKRPPSVSVIAQEDCRVLAVDQQLLLAEFKINEGMAARFYRALAVFLSDRLRSATTGTSIDGQSSQQDFEDANELDETILDGIQMAGDRLIRLIDALEGRGTI